MKVEVSVCIPIYYKESESTINKCLNSLLKQTYQPAEIVCALDQPSESSVEEAIDSFSLQHPFLIKKCYTARGSGLGAVLKTGIENCSYETIARMDIDDIAREDRIEREYQFLQEHPEVDVVGSGIAEFDETVEHIIAYREVPENDEACKKMLRRRDPINHMTAMFRKSSVLKAGNYNADMHSCEDTYLWTAFYQRGMRFANIQDNLVLVHAGSEMYARRGGKKAYSFVKKAIGYKKDVGLITFCEAAFQRLTNFTVLVVLPNNVRAMIYEKLLRRKAK